MEGQLGEEQCLKCSEQVTSPRADNPLLPKIYHCPECHKDFENAHAYSGHFNIHKRERMNLALNSSMTPMKRKENPNSPCNQPRPSPRLPTSLGNQMPSGNVGNPIRGSPNRSADTSMHPRNSGNTSHGSINRSMEGILTPSRNVSNFDVIHNPTGQQGSQSGRVGWAQPITPMTRGPVQAQFGHVSQRPLQGDQSAYLRWARHFNVDPVAHVPIQAGSQSGHVERDTPFGNPTTHGLTQASSQYGYVERARPFGRSMSYTPSGSSQSGQFGWRRPNRMNHSHQYSHGGCAGHVNPVYVDCTITTTVRITGSYVPDRVPSLNINPENLSTGEVLPSTMGNNSTAGIGSCPPEGEHEEKRETDQGEELDLTLRL